MRVAFLHVGANIAYASLMVASVNRAMPGIEIVQMTEPTTPSVPGITRRADHAYRGGGLMDYRLWHLWMLGDGETISLDTDVIVQRDMRPVFGIDFDVALTKRLGQIMLKGVDIVPEQPYNAGVMFSRKCEFWGEAGAWCAQLPASDRKWFGEQKSIAAIAKMGKYTLVELPCSLYNRSPESEHEDMSACYAIHYKGKRKEWMANREHLALAQRAPVESNRGWQWQTT